MLKSDIAEIYCAARAFALACPLLFAIPVVIEGAQHVVELLAGMYVDKAGAKAAEADATRLQFGYAKTLALLLPGYWFTRFMMFEGDADRAARIEMPAFALWLVLFCLGAAQSAWGLFGPAFADLLALEGIRAGLATLAVFLGMTTLTLFLAAWQVAWPLGNPAIGPLRSIGLMWGSIWHAAALLVAGVVPLMVLHYAFAIAAVLLLPAPLDWLAMVLDSILVGFLSLTLVGAQVQAVRRAAARKGVSLLPAPGPGVTT